MIDRLLEWIEDIKLDFRRRAYCKTCGIEYSICKDISDKYFPGFCTSSCKSHYEAVMAGRAKPLAPYLKKKLKVKK